MKKYFLPIFLAIFIAFALSGCQSAEIYSSPPLPESVIYMADGIQNSKVQMAWLEIPEPRQPGDEYVRLFLGKNEPPEPTIPNPNDLRCTLTVENEFAILGPEKVLFEFADDGSFTGSYTYKACPDCIECYMNWDYTLEMSGSITEDTVNLDIAIVHFGHNVQGSYVSAKLVPAKNVNKEPRIKCNSLIECSKIKFVTVK